MFAEHKQTVLKTGGFSAKRQPLKTLVFNTVAVPVLAGEWRQTPAGYIQIQSSLTHSLPSTDFGMVLPRRIAKSPVADGSNDRLCNPPVAVPGCSST